MIVVVMTDEGDEIWRSGEPVRAGSEKGLCCDQNRLPALMGELHAAFCQAAILRRRFDDSYRVPDACCSPAEIEDDVPVSGLGSDETGG